MSSRRDKFGIAVTAVASIGAVGAIASYVWLRPQATNPQAHWASIDTYCLDCHNADDRTADISFESLSPAAVTQDPALFESVVRKLRGHQMPPPGRPQPAVETRRELVSWLEMTLDAAASARPVEDIALHRLNRTEYANAVEDLFGMRVDVASLLPKDDVSDGFDNIANVLKVSPTFLEQHIDAARVVSELVVGNPAAKLDSRVYYNDPTRNQNFHVAGMPLGTRGGMLVEHYFPLDAEYEISIGGLARARYVEGLEYRHRLVLIVDGVEVFADDIGGADDLAAVDLRQAAAVADINARFERIRIPLTAGTHKIAATFVARTMAESESVLQPFVPGGGEVGIIEGEESPLKITRLQIDGPLTHGSVGHTPGRASVFVCTPADESAEQACARDIVTALTRRAFRRPVGDSDIEQPMQFYENARRGADFEAGIRSAVMFILASPEFLYRVEGGPGEISAGRDYFVDDTALASRLSFFIWSSVPDARLLELAENGRLKEPDVLAAEVERMLADPRAASLVTNFAVQWLDVRDVKGIMPDPVLFPEYNPELGEAFAEELRLFLSSILLEEHSVLELLDSNMTYANERLALHYGLDDVRGSQFRPVELADENRWGLFGKGAILMTTSYPNRTAPVLRGAWILETLLGTPPPAPPPNVEAFPENQEGEMPRTVRERLEHHRENPTCNGCHGVMDPLGFALESFDAIGAWRDKDRETTTGIDDSGQLADGTVVQGPVDLREALLEDPTQFVQTLTEKLMTFALGRAIDYRDMPAVRHIVRAAATNDYRFSAIVTGIVLSDAFRKAPVPPSDGASSGLEPVATQADNRANGAADEI